MGDAIHLDHALLVVLSLEILSEENRVDLRRVVVEVLHSLLTLNRRFLEMAAGLLRVEPGESATSNSERGKSKKERTNPLVDGEVREAENVVGVFDRLVLSAY